MRVLLRRKEESNIIFEGEALVVKRYQNHVQESRHCSESPNSYSIYQIHFAGTSIFDFKYRPQKKLTATREFEEGIIKFHFNLEGIHKIGCRSFSKSTVIPVNHFGLFFDPYPIEEYEFEAQSYHHFIEIIFCSEQFYHWVYQKICVYDEFCKSIEKNQPMLLGNQFYPINQYVSVLLHQILNAPFQGEIKSLFLQSKMIEILALIAAKYEECNCQKEVSVITNRDREKIYEVKRILDENLTSPPTLMELCRMVGLNDFKLKKGFKELFQTTVYGYVINQKLELAKQMLATTDEPIANIAFLAGYSTTANFSNAFKKKFGFSPSALRKNSFRKII
ncbi:MAG: AraC family transcriptional regulator [Bacteroidia bacterium]|nr:AraC family transcriptional regulator [Bacteroidia bacterium]MDW8159088.1 AraC family transcriptional regulator [Bacteroidia bacterium]